jgi:hypothetical protein
VTDLPVLTSERMTDETVSRCARRPHAQTAVFATVAGTGREHLTGDNFASERNGDVSKAKHRPPHARSGLLQDGPQRLAQRFRDWRSSRVEVDVSGVLC